MYAGEIVEQGPTEQIFDSPQHPYTWALLRSLPRVDAARHQRLPSIEGLPPDLIAPPPGCKFNPRCPFRLERCFHDAPELKPVGEDQVAACWVTMKRAVAEMGAGPLVDTRPGAASGVRPSPRHGDGGGPWSRTGRTGIMTSAPAEPPPVDSLPAPSGQPLLRAVDVVKQFHVGRGAICKAVDGVSFEIRAGETVGLVGEFGVRQVDAGPSAHPAHPGHLGPGDLRGGRADRDARREPASAAQAPPDDLPGSLRLARPAHDGGRHHRRAAHQLRVDARQGEERPGAGAAPGRRSQPVLQQPLPARVQRRPAAAHRHRPRPGPRTPS